MYLSKLIDSDDPLKWTTVTDIDLGEGGSFLLDNNLDQKYLPRILGLFSELVRFQFDKKGTDDNVKDHKVKRKHRYKLIVPPDFGPKSSCVESTESKGLGIDRSICKIVESLTNKIEELDEFGVRELKKKTNQINKLKAECGRLTADLMREKLLHTQVGNTIPTAKAISPSTQ